MSDEAPNGHGGDPTGGHGSGGEGPAGDEQAHLLVVWASRGGTTRSLVDDVVAGAADDAIDGVEVRALHATDAGPDDVAWADALIVCAPTHFGSVAGLVKDWLERIYHPCLETTRGLPWALVTKGDTDVDGTVRQLDAITTGLGWREARPPLAVVGDVTEAHHEAAWELGATVAAGLAYGGL